MLCINLLSVWTTLFWVFRLSATDEISSCPDLKVSLKCEEKDQISKLMDNDYRCVVNNEGDVTLKCSLQDAEHETVKNVVYTFYRASKFDSSKVLSLDSDDLGDKLEQVSTCTGGGDKDVCELTSVKWAKAEPKTGSSDPTMVSSDNHFYQCVAEVTLIDDLTFKLVSNSMFLDVMSPPVGPVTISKQVTVNTGYPTEDFACVLPESNPPTIPKWTFDGVEIDIKSSTRGNRLAIDGGTLLVMNYTPDEDEGTYKCKGVYTNLLSGSADTFDISEYTVTSSGNNNNGVSVVEVVSSIVTPILVDQDSPVSFTTYFKDSGAVVNTVPVDDLLYSWQYYNEEKIGAARWEPLSDDNEHTMEIMKYVTIENSGRTLTVNDTNALFAGEDNESTQLKCEGKRGDVKKDGKVFGNNELPVQFYLPEEFDIPTSCSFINKVDAITTRVNEEYMKKDDYDPTDLQKQYLIKSTSTFQFNGDVLRKLTNAKGSTLTEDVEMIFPANIFAEKFPGFKDGRCLYFQYMNAIYNEQVTAGYQIFETSTVDRSESVPPSVTCSAKCIKDTSITVTLDESDATQCLSAQLEKSNTVVSATPKSFTKVAAKKCSEREKTVSFMESDLVSDTTLTGKFDVKIYSCESIPICTTPCDFELDPDPGTGWPWWIIIIVVLALLILWGVIAVLQYKGCCCTAVPVYPACCCKRESSDEKGRGGLELVDVEKKTSETLENLDHSPEAATVPITPLAKKKATEKET